MKTLLISAVMGIIAVPLLGGCATPAYSGGLPTIKFPQEKATGENMNNILRNMAYENRQLMDDINSVILMEDQPAHMTKWNLR
jgi:hypothetical protein